MIIIKNLTVKNFMSVGNQTQGVNFNSENLTLVLGENLDQGGDDAGSRNGTGKTTIINALSYALYGQALTNIKRNNLINKTNNKGMVIGSSIIIFSICLIIFISKFEYLEAYKNKYLDQLKDHILAIESDAGVFKPKGFGFTGPDESLNILQDIGTLLKPIQSGVITKGGGGAGIGLIMKEGVPGMGLIVESEKYFWYHHTAADTWDKLNIQEFNQCVATMAVMSYVVADMDIRLPK